MKGSLRPGLAARLEYVVPAERTVPHPLPESDEFAALPAVLATGFLVGSPLTVQAELANVDDRQLTFTVHAVDDAATVCRGVHRRAVVDTERFLARLSKRATS